MKIELIRTHVTEVLGPVVFYVGLFLDLREPILVGFTLFLL
jgi:hypothetical protein